MRFDVEYTDTFAGEANYSWVRRAEIEAPANASDSLIMRRAKKVMGLSGVRGKVETRYSASMAFWPHGSSTVMFIMPRY